jgi:hypothetical protein
MTGVAWLLEYALGKKSTAQNARTRRMYFSLLECFLVELCVTMLLRAYSMLCKMRLV